MNKLWYKHTAKEWVEAMPIGNGHMGAMVYGGMSGKYDLSSNECWSGKPHTFIGTKTSKESMAKARELLLEGKVGEAEKLIDDDCCLPKDNYGTQLPLGRLFVNVNGECTDETRELDLITGVACEKLVVDGNEVVRESFISNPSKVMCVKISSNKPLPLLNVWLEGYSNPTRTIHSSNTITAFGRALENIHSDGLHGVEYQMVMDIETDGLLQSGRDTTYISGATSVTLYISSGTNFFNNDYIKETKDLIANAKEKGYEALKEEHIKEHSELMNRCSFSLEANENTEKATDERLDAYKNDESDLDLITTFFQFGRYVIINSTRKDSTLPAALQGVWNDNRAARMEWTDDMHLDINTQMNYYPTHVTGVGECNLPLLKWIKDILMPNGKITAEKLYGASGWMAHTISNAYGFSSPGWQASWGTFITGGGWITHSVWEYYEYTGDKEFLKEYYPVIEECAKFLYDMLALDPKSGYMVTVPSYSPENFYKVDENDSSHCICIGSTVDTTITKDIFRALINANNELGLGNDTTKYSDVMEKMPNYMIGKDGRLMEWLEEYLEPAPDHRHTSHLLSMHPFNTIDPKYQPEFKDAILKSIKTRLGENAKDIVLANWAGALLVTYYARLLEGETAGEFLQPMMKFLARKNLMITHEGPLTLITGGIYELDGNTGFTAAVCEMLMQAYTDEIRILPSIPSSWTKGSVHGLVCPKGHKVNIDWSSEKVSVVVYSNADDSLKVAFGDTIKQVNAKKGESYSFVF